MRTIGCDVSHWEGIIDWSAAAAWIAFAYYKCTDGVRYLDTTFNLNKAGCQAAGIPHAPYHWFQPEQDPIDQAAWFIQKAGAGYHRLIVDVEQKPEYIPDLADDVHAFLLHCEQLSGIKPAIYTSPGFWNEFIKPKPEWSRDYDLLVANYTIDRSPLLPIGWDTFTIWQFTENWWFQGCQGNADGDWFNGPLDQCRDWFGNYRQVDPPVYDQIRLRSLFDNLHVRQTPSILARELGHLSRGDAVDLQELGGGDVWVKHDQGWSAVEIAGYRYMEVVKDVP